MLQLRRLAPSAVAAVETAPESTVDGSSNVGSDEKDSSHGHCSNASQDTDWSNEVRALMNEMARLRQELQFATRLFDDMDLEFEAPLRKNCDFSASWNERAMAIGGVCRWLLVAGWLCVVFGPTRQKKIHFFVGAGFLSLTSIGTKFPGNRNPGG